MSEEVRGLVALIAAQEESRLSAITALLRCRRLAKGEVGVLLESVKQFMESSLELMYP